jgi:hypothetical protein
MEAAERACCGCGKHLFWENRIKIAKFVMMTLIFQLDFYFMTFLCSGKRKKGNIANKSPKHQEIILKQ